VLLYLLLEAAVALTLNFNSLQGTLLHRDRTRTEPVTGCSSSEHPYITPIPYRLHNLQKTLLFLVFVVTFQGIIDRIGATDQMFPPAEAR
jgi:hypothetical protein